MTQPSNIEPDLESLRPLRHRLRKGDQLFFLHIPKTAGTSLIDILQMQVEPGEYLSIPNPEAITPEMVEALQTARIVRSHRSYHFLKYFARRPYVIAMLRNPIDRVISNFVHLQAYLPSRLLDIARNANPDRGEEPVSLEEYIQSPLARNLLVQFLSGFHGALQPPLDYYLMMAKIHLESLAWFGLAERFDDSIKLLTYTFDWPPIHIEAKLNIAPSDSKPRITSEVEALLKEMNGLDMELYQYAAVLFDHRFQQMERELQEQVGS